MEPILDFHRSGRTYLRYVNARSVLVLLIATATAACSDGDQSVDTQVLTKIDMAAETTPTRRCYRNEYAFEGEPNKADVESLTIEINGVRAVGEYNWLPAFKDHRLGQFEGTVDGQTVTASYEYTQEGRSDVATILIELESEQVVVEGGSPELGLNATIARVDC
jgi:hypothetical protein